MKIQRENSVIELSEAELRKVYNACLQQIIADRLQFRLRDREALDSTRVQLAANAAERIIHTDPDFDAVFYACIDAAITEVFGDEGAVNGLTDNKS